MVDRLLRRALLACSLAIGLVMGSGIAFAYWQFDGQIDLTQISQPLTTGTFDLTAGPSSGTEALAGPGGTYQWDAFNVGNLYPGESQAQSLVVRNSGNGNMSVAVTGSATQSGFDQYLTVTVYASPSAATNAAPSNNTRSGSCAGNSIGLTSADIMAAGANLGTLPTLAPGATTNLCVVITVAADMPQPSAAPTANLTFGLTATQVQ